MTFSTRIYHIKLQNGLRNQSFTMQESIGNIASKVQNKNYLTYLNKRWYEYSWHETKQRDWKLVLCNARFMCHIIGRGRIMWKTNTTWSNWMTFSTSIYITILQNWLENQLVMITKSIYDICSVVGKIKIKKS